MGVAYNSRIITDGLVLALDAANTKSYPGILDNIVGWRLPSTYYIRGTLLDNDRTWSSEPSTGYSSVILNKTFNAGENFEVIAYWARNYRGIGMIHGPNVSIFDFTGYSADGTGPYFGALNTTGFPSGYSATFFGQYHSPIAGQGDQTTGYWFKWARTGNTLSLQYSATSSSGPWTNILADVSINSTDKVIIGAGEASGTEVSDLSLISVGPGPYTWTDLSTNGNTGTLVNGPTYSSANGGSLVFDGYDERVSTNYKPSGERSYFIWVKFSSLTHSSGYQLTGTQESNAYTYIGIQNGGDIYYYAGANTGGNIGNPVSVNTWVNLGFVLNADGSRIVYKNGVNIHSNTGGLGGTATAEFSVGCINQNHFITGNISQVSIYNRALSAAEVAQNFNALRRRFEGKVFYYEGNDARNFVSNWNDQEIFNMTTTADLGNCYIHGWGGSPRSYTLSLTNLPTHTEVRYECYIHMVDSLDNETSEIYTRNSAGTESLAVRWTKQYNQVPNVSTLATGMIFPFKTGQTYSYRPWGNGAYGNDGYASFDTGFYAHTGSNFSIRHYFGADQGSNDEAYYISHVKLTIRYL